MKPSVACQNVVRFLGKDESRNQVLKSVSLEAFAGKVYSIIGPSGCGKSTLLYLLGLLDRPDEGQIWVDQLDTGEMDEFEAAAVRTEYIGFVFQFHFLLNEFTAIENVMLPMQKCGRLSRKEMKENASYLLNEVGLGDKIHRRANHLSGGEQQRVAIARALANQPKIILADEPTGNLDIQNSTRVFELMKKIAREKELTLIIVSHNPSIAAASDVILKMEDGRIVE
jgi:lipoprotein-releasing system ATP-binding protein